MEKNASADMDSEKAFLREEETFGNHDSIITSLTKKDRDPNS